MLDLPAPIYSVATHLQLQLRKHQNKDGIKLLMSKLEQRLPHKREVMSSMHACATRIGALRYFSIIFPAWLQTCGENAAVINGNKESEEQSLSSVFWRWKRSFFEKTWIL